MLRYDAIGPLLTAGDPALGFAVRRDLLGRRIDERSLWTLPRVLQALRSQNDDGSWTYRGGTRHLRSAEDYAQLATFQQLLVLVSQYRMDRRHPSIKHAAEFMLGHQTLEGDIRGIYAAQYSPNYTADILRLLIAAGLTDDPRVIKGIEWLLSMRQNDGGWAVPLRTVGGLNYTRALGLPEPVQPNRTRPSSHLITGIVLRPLAAHRAYRHRPEVKAAALLLASRFFRQDSYADRRDASYWSKLAFPFRWTDIASALDVMAQIGLKSDEVHVARGLAWLIAHQTPSGLWRSGYRKSPDPLTDHWVTFAVARVLHLFYRQAAFASSRVMRSPVQVHRAALA